MKPYAFLTAAAALAMAASPALAADDSLPPEFRTGTFDIYLGTFISGITLGSEYEDVLAEENHGLDGGAFGWGVRGGVDYLVGNWVFGVVGDGNFYRTIAEDDKLDSELEIPVLGTFRGRAGYKWGETLVYATGGYALAEMKFKTEVPDLGEEVNEEDWAHGWTLGLGADYAITDALSVGLEYLYVSLDDVTYGSGEEYKQTFDGISTIRLGLDYRFHI